VSLHYLDQVTYKLSVMMLRCLLSQSPLYLMDYCQADVIMASLQHLRSVVSRCRSIGLKCLADWLDRLLGTLSWIISGRLIALLTVSNICLRYTCLHGT